VPHVLELRGAERMHEHASTINNNPMTGKKDEYGIETKEKRNY